jgi:lysophospholipase L1-like esterase
VALGSSIASGYGISVQSTDCGRSDRSYPNLIARRYGLDLVDVTCGAASIPNVVDTPQGPNPPQLDAVTPDTELITVTVGGNDIGYNATALGCGDPASVCTLPAGLDANVATTRTALAAMLDQIRAAAPAATIVFVTYPREVPDPGEVPGGNCPELAFTDEEATVVRTMGEQLEAIFVEVASTDDDVVLVDPYVAPGDHTGCAAPSERWTAGRVADDGFAYHPTALGHEAMAQLIVDQLGS